MLSIGAILIIGIANVVSDHNSRAYVYFLHPEPNLIQHIPESWKHEPLSQIHLKDVYTPDHAIKSEDVIHSLRSELENWQIRALEDEDQIIALQKSKVDVVQSLTESELDWQRKFESFKNDFMHESELKSELLLENKQNGLNYNLESESETDNFPKTVAIVNKRFGFSAPQWVLIGSFGLLFLALIVTIFSYKTKIIHTISNIFKHNSDTKDDQPIRGSITSSSGSPDLASVIAMDNDDDLQETDTKPRVTLEIPEIVDVDVVSPTDYEFGNDIVEDYDAKIEELPVEELKDIIN